MKIGNEYAMTWMCLKGWSALQPCSPTGRSRKFASVNALVGAALFVVSIAVMAASPVELWSTATATRPSDGWVMVYRFAEKMAPDFKKASQPERVSMVWRYDGSKGLPTVTLRESMDAFEDAIESTSQPAATLTIVSTGNNQRRWVYYTRSARHFIESARRLPPKESGVSIEFETSIDPEWTFHDSFVRSIRR